MSCDVEMLMPHVCLSVLERDGERDSGREVSVSQMERGMERETVGER